MNEDRVLIESAVARATVSSHGWMRAMCPICPISKGSEDKKKSFRYRPDNGYYDCMRCGVKGWLKGDYSNYEETEEEEDNKDAEWKRPPEGFMLLSEEPARSAHITKRARNYLISRNVGPKVWERMKIGITFKGKYKDRIIVPIIIQDKWYGWSGRMWEENPYRLTYRNASDMPRGDVLWNQDFLYFETNDPITAVEGVFDGLPHIPTIDVIAFLGKPNENHFALLLETNRPIVIALDGDSWSEAEALSKKLNFRGKKAGFIKFPPKKDPGNLKPGGLRKLALQALE